MYGVPECLSTDHGSDFTSKHLEAVGVDLKMALIFSQVGRPRGRGKVERWFRTVREEVLSTLPGYERDGWRMIGGGSVKLKRKPGKWPA